MQPASSLIDQYVGAIAEAAGEGFSAVDDVWREIPDSFDEFVTGARHLRLGSQYPRRREIA